MEIRGKVKDILVKEGKDHDVRFALGLQDTDVVRLFLLRGKPLVINLEVAADQLMLPEDAPAATIRINGQDVATDASELSGWQIKQLAGVEPADFWLFGYGHDADSNADICQQIGDEDRIPLAPWFRFVTTRPGGVPIVIDDVDHAVADVEAYGSQLKQMAGVAPDAELYVLEAVAWDDAAACARIAERLVRDDELVVLGRGERFVTKLAAEPTDEGAEVLAEAGV